MSEAPKQPRPGTLAATIVALWDAGEKDTTRLAKQVGRSRHHVNGALRNAGRVNARKPGRPRKATAASKAAP